MQCKIEKREENFKRLAFYLFISEIEEREREKSNKY